jgi:hypothetical protein
MPLDETDKKYYDFEKLYFETGCDIESIISNFFLKYDDMIKGDREYITYQIKKTIEEDRNYLSRINGEGQDCMNRIGRVSYLRHDVVPEQNNGKHFYVYQINSFIPVKK